MKQSYGRLLAARLMSPAAAMGAAAAVVVGISACHNNNNTPCPNLSQATLVLGEPNFTTPQTSSISAAGVAGPQGSVAINPSNGDVYIADTFNNRVLVYTSIPTANGASANAVLGQPCLLTALTVDPTSGGPGAATAVPAACTSGGTLNAYFLNHPQKVQIAPSGQLVITDSGNNRVLIFNTPPADNTVAPDVIIGQANINTNAQNSGGISASSLYVPSAAIIASSQLIIADKGNNRVLIWNTLPAKGASLPAATDELGQINYPTTIVGSNPATLGPPCTTNSGADGFCFTTNIANTGDHYDNTSGEYNVLMNSPTDVYNDGNYTYVSDSGTNRVLVYSGVPTNTASTSTSSGMNQQPNFLLGVATFSYGFGKPGSGAQAFNNPTAITVSQTNLFIADTGNNRVLQFQLPISTNATAQEVFGQQDFTHTTQNDPDQNGQVGDQRNNPATIGPVNGTLWAPSGVFDNGNGDLFVTDTSNNRVLIYQSSGGVNGTDTNLCS